MWAILALRALLPAGLLGRTLVPGGRVVLEAARLQVELPLSSVLHPVAAVPDQWVAPVQAPQGAHPHPGPHVAMAEVEQLVEEHLVVHWPAGERQHRAQGAADEGALQPGQHHYQPGRCV